jgi:hypothetical protein
MDVDGVARVIIANADYGMALQVKHHRSASIDFRFELGKGKAASDGIVRLLVVAIGNGITSGLIEEFSPIGPIERVNPIRLHCTAG